METSEYLEQLLLRYEETYDIYKPYYIGSKISVCRIFLTIDVVRLIYIIGFFIS